MNMTALQSSVCLCNCMCGLGAVCQVSLFVLCIQRKKGKVFFTVLLHRKDALKNLTSQAMISWLAFMKRQKKINMYHLARAMQCSRSVAVTSKRDHTFINTLVHR